MSEASEDEKTPVEEMRDNVELLKGSVDEVDASPDDVAQEEVEYTDTEVQAMDKGWNPDKESVPEGKDWVSAGEFMRNEKYFSEMRRLRREVSNTNKNFEELKSHHKKVEEVTREKLMATLKRQKKEAMEEGNHDEVIEIDDQLLDLKTTKNETNERPEQENNVFASWVEDNGWYEDDDDMRETADELGDAFAARSGGKPDTDKLFKHVDRRMRVLYPDKFDIKPKVVKRKVVAAVEPASSGRASAPKKAPKYTVKDLNEQQLRVMRNFEKSGAIKPQDYIDELARIGELG